MIIVFSELIRPPGACERDEIRTEKFVWMMTWTMSRVDSGNESQEGSPDTTASEPALLHTPPRLSAVLTQGKVVIRPVAYKPSALANSRFSNCGQRYGSTPILARPNSHLALYGMITQQSPRKRRFSIDVIASKIISLALSKNALEIQGCLVTLKISAENILINL
ncbi:hypothetical protein GE061_007476 [Apolygus lucorum]|uniref:Uncharacterized protein n=1 Tax=Apolygus lucorum TaxID=248454 RepID=A0A8S9WR95_APOLU|nr:hypothetical protein GE061_007476 [Apolygus lucorum]